MAVVNIYRTKRRYATILADPPWRYDRNQTESKGERSFMDRLLPYTSMTTDEIAALPISRICAGHATLWLWTTNAHIHEALHVMETWGLKYRGMRTWLKPHIGTGFWLRGQTEHLLLGTRGNPLRAKQYDPQSANKGVSTALLAPAGKHSSKPPESYRDIERMSKEPRIELFARRPRKGWDSWGNEAKEIDKKLERDIRRLL